MKHGFMMAVDLYACQVLNDPALLVPTEGYVVSFTTFYERGFGMPPHQFLCSLLWCYGLELHHLNPLGVLHITDFVTLCEAYLEIDPDLDLWMYFFRVRHSQDLEAELMISGSVVIHVKLGLGVDPYLEIPMSRLMKGWQKKWFYLKNNDSTHLLVFIGGHPVPVTPGERGQLGTTSTEYNPCGNTFNICGRRV
jgi:hypothetical protein